MPPLLLSAVEARILGSLIEKSMTTPDQYPLSLNSLTNACNQKTSRDPVMDLDETDVARTLATLQQKNLVGRRSEPGSRVIKFLHQVENLLNGGNSKEIGVVCVLLLRGPQTAGEIRTRTDRLCEFAGPAEVEIVLNDLASRTDGPFVERLARETGQKEMRWRHLFSETPTTTKTAPSAPPMPKSSPVFPPDRLAQLEKRIEALEKRLDQLRP